MKGAKSTNWGLLGDFEPSGSHCLGAVVLPCRVPALHSSAEQFESSHRGPDVLLSTAGIEVTHT